MNKPEGSLVSVLLPVYNVGPYIEKCCRSLFEQTCANIEYIFVDDCSTDNSINIIEQVSSEYPVRSGHVQIIRHQKNRGLAASRNFESMKRQSGCNAYSAKSATNQCSK